MKTNQNLTIRSLFLFPLAFLRQRLFYAFMLLFVLNSAICSENEYVGLTLIPPDQLTNKVDLDIRAGVILDNNRNQNQKVEVSIYLDKESKQNLIYYTSSPTIKNNKISIRHIIKTTDLIGDHKIILKVKTASKKQYSMDKKFRVIDSDIRSTKQIDGAWAGIYHWSETEGKNWNEDIKKMSNSQWSELVRSMNKLEMNTIVVQEVFRNEEYVGKHNLNLDNYQGKAFYPSKIYVERMPISAEDPLEAILSEADKHGMNVFMGVGMYAWFDFTEGSLEWHKKIAKELWDKYGHHPSFYGFYVSEESGGSLDNWESTVEGQLKRKQEIVRFFQEFKLYCNDLAPDKPIMLATNSMGVPTGEDTYPSLLQNLDILCPFGFARMPEGDLTGKEAADRLQALCDRYGSHLWFDLEVFLFNPDQSLYPRPMDEIIKDLTLFDNFEKILCYQYPGVFSDPEASIQVGEDRTKELFVKYQEYLKTLKLSRKK